jgi:hypothetical protein
MGGQLSDEAEADFLDLALDCAAEIGEAIVVVSGTMPTVRWAS